MKLIDIKDNPNITINIGKKISQTNPLKSRMKYLYLLRIKAV